MSVKITLRTFFFKDNVKRKSILLAGDFDIKLLHFELNKKIQNFINLMFQFGLVPTTNKPARIMKDTISAIDHKITNSIINDEFKTAILTADISEYFPKIYAFKLKTILDIHRGNPSSTYAQSGGEGSSQIRTNAYKRGGGSNFGDFCAYVLCE